MIDKGAADPIEIALCATTQATGIPRQYFMGPRRGNRDLAYARFIAWRTIRKTAPWMSLQAIGALFERHHSTIMKGAQQAENLIHFDAAFRAKAELALELATQT